MGPRLKKVCLESFRTKTSGLAHGLYLLKTINAAIRDSIVILPGLAESRGGQTIG